MNKKIDINEIKELLAHTDVIELKDIDMFYREREPSIPKTTVNWRVYALIQDGALQRIGKGVYRFGKTQRFVPEVNDKMKTVGQIINKKFPFINYCQWELSCVNYFSQHLINFNVLFVDVERDALNSVYYELKDHFSKVMLIQNLYDDLSEFDTAIFVRPLITDSPVQKVENTRVATLEKILVDLSTDKEFVFVQGNEIYTILETAMEKYTINRQTMFRYAGRKHKREEIEKITKTINRQ